MNEIRIWSDVVTQVAPDLVTEVAPELVIALVILAIKAP